MQLDMLAFKFQQLDFDTTRNVHVVTFTVVFMDSPDKTAENKFGEYIDQFPEIKIYIANGGQIYPQFYVERVQIH
jgi:hypothetical protein